MKSNSEKTVLVIGASSGYGAGILEALINMGYRVIGASRTIPQDSQATYYGHLDVTSPEAIEAFFEKLKQLEVVLDAVVYSAGLAIGIEPVEQGSPEAWERVFKTNTLGLLNVARKAIPMLKKSQGHLIHIGSIAAFIQYKGAVDYCASKAASNSIMKGLRYELLGKGIKTTSIEPGLGATNFQLNRYNGDEEAARKHYKNIKQLDPADIAEVVLWLLQQPAHVNIDEVVVKPLGQANHGFLADK